MLLKSSPGVSFTNIFTSSYSHAFIHKSCSLAVESSAHDQKIMGSNPVQCQMDMVSKPCQPCQVNDCWCLVKFLDASNNWKTNCVLGNLVKKPCALLFYCRKLEFKPNFMPCGKKYRAFHGFGRSYYLWG